MRCTGLLWLAVVVSLAGPVSAATLSVEFDFTGSTVTLLGGVVVVPPDGTITVGSGRITFLADEFTQQAIAGPAQLADVGLALTLDANLLGQAHITGTVAGSQVGGASGSLNGALTQVSLLGPLQILYTGTVQCAGSGCGAVGTFPVTLGTILTFLGSFGVGNLASVGNATVNATLPFSLAGFTGILQLSGAEVSRVFVPEPGSFGLLALGLGALAGSAQIRRRRSRR